MKFINGALNQLYWRLYESDVATLITIIHRAGTTCVRNNVNIFHRSLITDVMVQNHICKTTKFNITDIIFDRKGDNTSFFPPYWQQYNGRTQLEADEEPQTAGVMHVFISSLNMLHKSLEINLLLLL